MNFASVHYKTEKADLPSFGPFYESAANTQKTVGGLTACGSICTTLLHRMKVVRLNDKKLQF